MSLSCKLIVYNYYTNYYNSDDNFHISRIIKEFVTNSYVDKKSCIEYDIWSAKQLMQQSLTFDNAVKHIDALDSIRALTEWFNRGTKTKINDVVCSVLCEIDSIIPLAERIKKGRSIYELDEISKPNEVVLHEKVDRLCVILKCFVHHIFNSKLLYLSYVFNPSSDTFGWWYNKFCVTTYIFKIVNHYDSIPQNIRNRLIKIIKEFVHCERQEGLVRIDKFSNCPEVLNNIYGRFCGIGKEDFNKHKVSCVYIFMQYLRDKVTDDERRNFECYEIIKDYGRQCKDVYTSNKDFIDTLFIHCDTDKYKNMLFDLLCVPDQEEIDVDCFYFIIEKFLNKF
ncbi:hypothetical protein [Parapoynx stagnalis nucleopolyhedrovirus]|uniref:Ac11 n=1 Tax=Parapoynx stagnalis nucleopolyhedrovirus TaxID=2993413 RepID=A0A9E7YE59_9ABAC|nr:hypothetical protein [Parapoynx stagnalis nucleopolyhedrovirus]